jgi:hypothetical protein
MLRVGALYGIEINEMRCLIDYLEVTEGGYFDLPWKRPTSLTKSEIAEHIQQLDSRLIRRKDRWSFG